MTLTFNWTEADYVSSYWAWLLRRPWKIALGFWYSFLILGMVVVGAITNPHNWRTQLVYAALALGAGILGFIRTRWNMHRSFKNALLPEGLVTTTVGERGIALKARGVERTLLWAELSRFYESSKVLVLEKGDKEYMFLPKMAMGDAQISELRTLAASALEQHRRNITETPQTQVDVEGRAIACVDDVPAVARLAARQRFLMKWYKPVGLAPFVVALIIALGFFPNSNSPILVDLVFGSLIWTLAVVVYTVYLWLGLRCPVCKNRFGLGENCRSCNLPRHSNSSGLFRASA